MSTLVPEFDAACPAHAIYPIFTSASPELAACALSQSANVDNQSIARVYPPHIRSNFLAGNAYLVVGCAPTPETLPTILAHGRRSEFAGIIIVNLIPGPCWYEGQVSGAQIIKFPLKSGRHAGPEPTQQLISYLLEAYVNKYYIYIHCKGGHGRAGTIASVLIGQLMNLDAPEAIDIVSRSRDTRADRSRNYIPTPELPNQVQLVGDMLGVKVGHTLPDRSDKSWLDQVKAERRRRKTTSV